MSMYLTQFITGCSVILEILKLFFVESHEVTLMLSARGATLGRPHILKIIKHVLNLQARLSVSAQLLTTVPVGNM